jgi:hypothetical protein
LSKEDRPERIDASHPHRIPATVLQSEIAACDYPNGISQLKALPCPRKCRKTEPLNRFAYRYLNGGV